jgi:prevent-host-death family protein
MSTHGVADARKKLSALIDRALKGETVVITRRGRPVAQLTRISPPLKPATSGAADWLIHRRVGSRMPREHAAAAVRRLRDEWAG